MREMSAAALPIEKRSLNTDDAMELFRREGLVHKAQLLSFRINSHVNVYSLDGFVDYFYGYMAPDTGYIRVFALELFENGFVLRLPTQKDPNQLGEFRPSIKVFRELYESTLRSQALNASNVAELNTTISQGRATPLILAHEAMMEKKIGDIADRNRLPEGGPLRHDRRTLLLRQDHLLPPAVHPAAIRRGAHSDLRRAEEIQAEDELRR